MPRIDTSSAQRRDTPEQLKLLRDNRDQADAKAQLAWKAGHRELATAWWAVAHEIDKLVVSWEGDS